ncbi:hypothetical protein CPB85DRAFT_1437939 [Mucidula mucida]|nr:hypothetical protein CPB85DRAFT_1437939 [Mucidula mucida]
MFSEFLTTSVLDVETWRDLEVNGLSYESISVFDIILDSDFGQSSGVDITGCCTARPPLNTSSDKAPPCSERLPELCADARDAVYTHSKTQYPVVPSSYPYPMILAYPYGCLVQVVNETSCSHRWTESFGYVPVKEQFGFVPTDSDGGSQLTRSYPTSVAMSEWRRRRFHW